MEYFLKENVCTPAELGIAIWNSGTGIVWMDLQEKRCILF